MVVVIDTQMRLSLNSEKDLGTARDPAKLSERLAEIFRLRDAGQVTERTVFVKAPRKLDYGSVVNVVDAIVAVGGRPVSLQLDDLP